MQPTRLDRTGIVAGLLAYFAWGLLPLLFLAAERAGAGAAEIVAWRTIWAVPCTFALVHVTGQGRLWRSLPASAYAALLASATLIGVNWLVYVHAVHTNQTITASLGYFINPLLNIAAGALLFSERIGCAGIVAVILAVLGVVLQGMALGALPWIPLVLGFSFCGYAVVRKRIAVTAQTGLHVECLILTPPALAYAATLAAHHHGVFGAAMRPSLILMVCGPATVVPLAAFAVAARRLPLTVVGFLQFLSPSLQFCVGLINGEQLTPLRLVSFLFIWAGVLVFASGAYGRRTNLWSFSRPRKKGFFFF